jgi:hypothetical protein
MRVTGIEVWHDWDRQLRGQIRDCTLFVPIVSANSQACPKGTSPWSGISPTSGRI